MVKFLTDAGASLQIHSFTTRINEMSSIQYNIIQPHFRGFCSHQSRLRI